MLTNPAEVHAMVERIEQLEHENQRLREIVSDVLDREATLQRLVRGLGLVVWRSE